MRDTKAEAKRTERGLTLSELATPQKQAEGRQSLGWAIYALLRIPEVSEECYEYVW